MPGLGRLPPRVVRQSGRGSDCAAGTRALDGSDPEDLGITTPAGACSSSPDSFGRLESAFRD